MIERFKSKTRIALVTVGSGLLLYIAAHATLHTSQFRYPFVLSEAPASTLNDDIALYEKRVARDPLGAFDPATLAELYVVQGKLTGDSTAFDRAEAFANLSLKNRSVSNPSARLVLADVAQAKHRFHDAIELASDLRRKLPGASEVLPILITSYLATGDLKNASEIADELVDSSPKINSYTLRALVKEAQGRDKEAIFNFTTALDSEEIDDVHDSIWTRCLFARFYIDHGKYDIAGDLLDAATKISPDDPLVLGLIARLHEETGKTELAKENYRHAFEKSKQIPFLIGEARTTANATESYELRDQAENLLRLELGGRGYGHRSELIRLLLERGEAKDLDEALNLANSESADRPNAESFHLLAWVQLKKGSAIDARAAMRKSLESGSEKPELLFHAGLIEHALNNERLASFYFSRAKALSSFLKIPEIDYRNKSIWPTWLAVR
jgi:tetratricopeptide (TPR) repeat protein